MKNPFNWKRPFCYFLIPIFIFLGSLRFPAPFAPPGTAKPIQEQSVPAEEHEKEARF